MPGANKYSVKVGNRFALNSAGSESESSEDELQNLDPFAMIKKAEVDAVKRVKMEAKNQEKNQKAAAIAAATGQAEQPAEIPAERKQQNQRNNRREPRGNQAPRRGPRNERNIENRENESSQANERQERRGDGERRRGQRPRDKDRQSGDPRSNMKAQPKRGGAGSYNWGKPGDEWEQNPEQEQRTPENVEEEKPAVEGGDNNVEEQTENQEPEQPKEPETMTLEQYMAQQSLGDDNDQRAARKANDGVQIKGQVLKKKQLHKEPAATKVVAGERVNQKTVIPSDKLNFSKYRPARFANRDGRDGGRDNREQRGGRQNNKKEQFKIQEDDFPTLGGGSKK